MTQADETFQPWLRTQERRCRVCGNYRQTKLLTRPYICQPCQRGAVGMPDPDYPTAEDWSAILAARDDLLAAR